MDYRRVLSISAGVAAALLLLGACAPASQPAAPAAPAQQQAAAGGDIYIPLVSKGFQHQFWQAVKQGAEKAATDYKVRITFEGPENESQVDKQVEMLQAALDKKPQAIGLAALDSKAVVPLLQKAKDAKIP